MSQPKQKSLVRQASRTSLLDERDPEGDGLQADTEEEVAADARSLPRDTSVAELLRNSIHSDGEDEVHEVKLLDQTVSSLASGDLGASRSSTPAVYSRVVPTSPSPMMTPMVPAMLSQGSMKNLSPARTGITGSAIDVRTMQKSFSSTSLQHSPGASSQSSTAVTASPLARQRVTRAEFTSGARSRMGTSPSAPLSRPIYGPRSATVIHGSLASVSSSTSVSKSSPACPPPAPGNAKPPTFSTKSSYTSVQSPQHISAYSAAPVRLGPGPVYPTSMPRSGSTTRIWKDL